MAYIVFLITYCIPFLETCNTLSDAFSGMFGKESDK